MVIEGWMENVPPLSVPGLSANDSSYKNGKEWMCFSTPKLSAIRLVGTGWGQGYPANLIYCSY